MLIVTSWLSRSNVQEIDRLKPSYPYLSNITVGLVVGCAVLLSVEYKVDKVADLLQKRLGQLLQFGYGGFANRHENNLFQNYPVLSYEPFYRA